MYCDPVTESIVYQASEYLGIDQLHELRVARTYTLSDVGCDRDALNVNNDIIAEIPRHL